jgi:hypothetical protein
VLSRLCRRSRYHLKVALGLEPYERRVEPAISALSALADTLTNELDQTNGAFPWWTGQSDWKIPTMIADYLIQSVIGAGEALRGASLAAKTHRESRFAEDTAVTAAWRKVGKSGATDVEAFLAAMPRDGQARRRDLTITHSAEHCFFHLGQTLDRLSAALIVVGGFVVRDLLASDWSSIVGTPTRQGLIDDLAALTARQSVQPVGSQARQIQVDLLGAVTRTQDFGPPGWLDWMRDTRNAMTHRSPATKLTVFVGDLKTGMRFVRLFYRQPRWSELQSIVFGGVTQSDPFFGAFVLRSSDDVLDGLCNSMTSLVLEMTAAMTKCWVARKADQSLIAQPESPWKSVQPTEPPSAFVGYGDDVSPHLQKADLMATKDGLRWQAGRVLDTRRADWTK